MKIVISRHAKRRMQLYNIKERDVINTIMVEIQHKHISSDKTKVVNQELKSKYGFPLKVVFCEKHGKIAVITAYPFRKER